MSNEDLVLSVLVYDTDNNVIKDLQEALKKIESGWSVEFHTAEDAETFETVLAQEEFHILFLNQQLDEDRTGLEVLEECRKSGYQRPIVLVAGDGDETLAARAFRKGVNDYLVLDNLSPGELKRSIEYVLRNYFQYDKDESETEKLLLFERRDSLTGFYNRVSLSNQLNDLYPKNQNIVLFFVGIANLERVNEVNGQEVGDRVIKKLGQELSDTFENDDVIGRVQGGDFCVVVDGKGQGYVKDKAKSLLGRLENNRINIDRQNTTPLNFIGCLVQKDKTSSDGHEFFCRGMDKLHKAKAGGDELQIQAAGT